MELRKDIAKALEKAIGNSEWNEERIVSALEAPKSPEFGDVAFPCFALAPLLRKDPKLIAEELKKKVQLPKNAEKAEAVNGYLNFFVKKAELAQDVIARVLKEKGNYGKAKPGKQSESHGTAKPGKESEGFGKAKPGRAMKIMIEYSSPNTNKPLHLGHLRNGALAVALSNIFESQGRKIIKAILFSDRGLHVCKSMLAYNLWGKGKTPQKEKVSGDKFVGNYYVMFAKAAKDKPELEDAARELLKKWEKGDKATIALWKKMNSWALKGFEETYMEFGSEFDAKFYESKFYKKAKPIIDSGLKKKVFEKNDEGAVVARLEKEGLADKVVLRADGTSIYITNDLALTKHKFEKYKPDESIWVTGSEQNLYFQQLFKIFELLGFPWARKCRHLSHGMVNIEGGRMKSREGTVVDANDIIAEMKALAEKELKERYPELAAKELDKRKRIIALGALKFYLLKIAAGRDIAFNPEDIIAFEGETGPFVQYSHARACSILRKAGKNAERDARKADFALLKEPVEKEVIAIIEKFPKIVQHSMQNLSAHDLCQYALELSSKFNSFYHELPVLKADGKLRDARLALVLASKTTLANCLKLLDIEAPEAM